MRNSVPFIGEQQISRAESDEAVVKRQSGKLIDEVIASSEAESSWDDVVPSWSSNRSKAIRPSSAISKPAAQQAPVGNQLVRGTRAAVKVPIHKATSNTSSKVTLATLDWLLINSGHGLRINIEGNIDHNLRDEWRRLLDETEKTQVKEFEFNLKMTPSLSMTGLGMLLLFKERKGSGRDAIKLCNCNQEVWKLLNWTGMDKYFLIQTSVDFK